MKFCPKCQQDKPTERFYKRKSSKDGLHPHCKDCCNQYEMERYNSNREWRELRKEQGRKRYRDNPDVRQSRIDYAMDYCRTPQGKTAKDTYVKSWQAKYPERRKAHNRVLTAIRNGTLPHPSTLGCQYPGCNKLANLYHHHNGYDKAHWLDVVAICTEHHGLIHRKAQKDAN